MKITGNKFAVQFGMAKAILEFKSETSLTFTITQKEGQQTDITETVAITMTELRPQLFMVTWQEASGTTVTQVQDYENETVYSNWTSPTGEFTNIKGTISPV
jgi:hypothetical protein